MKLQMSPEEGLKDCQTDLYLGFCEYGFIYLPLYVERSKHCVSVSHSLLGYLRRLNSPSLKRAF